jgi:hypothetical protein
MNTKKTKLLLITTKPNKTLKHTFYEEKERLFVFNTFDTFLNIPY